MITMQKLACTLVAAAIATSASGAVLVPAALAQERIDVIGEPLPEGTVLVAYNDLNLTTDAGTDVLEDRVRQAVRQVCRDQLAEYPRSAYGVCRSEAWSGARPQIDRAVHRAHQIAATGTSEIAAVVLTISAPRS